MYCMLFRRPHESSGVVRNFMYRTFGYPDIGTRIRGGALFSLFDIVKGSSILEVGVGCGVYTYELEKRGFNVFAVDLLKCIGVKYDGIKRVRSVFSKGNLDFRFVQADAVVLPFDSGSFDAVIAPDVLEHIADDVSALREINRVLKKGGKLLVSAPSTGFHYGRFKRVFRWLYVNTPLKNFPIWNLVCLFPERMMRAKGHQREYSLDLWRSRFSVSGFDFEKSADEYKFFGAFFVELSHTFRFFYNRNFFFYLFYPFVFLDRFIPINATGYAVRARKK